LLRHRLRRLVIRISVDVVLSCCPNIGDDDVSATSKDFFYPPSSASLRQQGIIVIGCNCQNSLFRLARYFMDSVAFRDRRTSISTALKDPPIHTCIFPQHSLRRRQLQHLPQRGACSLWLVSVFFLSLIPIPILHYLQGCWPSACSNFHRTYRHTSIYTTRIPLGTILFAYLDVFEVAR
jgi:hypothetical protein